jgi:hypothetical protein
MDMPPIQENRLLISLLVPFRAVFGKTISLWFVKKFRLSSGIDTKIFSAHLAGSDASPLAVSRGLSISSGVTIWFKSRECR